MNRTPDLSRRLLGCSSWLKESTVGGRALAAIVLMVVVSTACGSSGDGPRREPDYQLVPAVESATIDGRITGFSTIPGAEDEAVALTQQGIIWRFPLDRSRPAVVFGDVSDRTPAIDLSILEEFGLLGLAFSPNFQVDGRVYLYYTAVDPPEHTILSRFHVVNGTMDLASEQILLEVPQHSGNHNGGQLAFGPDGYLYLGLGDGGGNGDPEENGQDLSTLTGSILRLDVSGEDYRIPPDNPFVDRADARPEIYAYGLRNPWRFSFDRATGDLWAADVGEERWEEVDRIMPGGNYGWNIVEGLECYDASSCDMSGLQPPRVVYGRDDGCAVTGGFVYRGPSMPELNGYYVYGDYCRGTIWAVNTADDSPPVLLAETGLLITTFGELADGELLALTLGGGIYRLQRALKASVGD